jgi:transposase InsO family protein
MQLFGIKPYKRKARWRKRRDERRIPALFQNQIKSSCPIVPNHTWVGDFTYLPFKKQCLYLATFMDLYTREIVGWHLATRHTKELVMEAFLDGLVTQRLRKPIYVHSDQGAEYTNETYTTLVQSFGSIVSMSSKASPWENGYQESFYNNFKTDLGLEFDRFSHIGQFTEAIAHTIHAYNTTRIHTKLRMPPSAFRCLHSP